jgi:hypothetical protein
MAESTEQQSPAPDPRLKRLEVLVGTWHVSGPTIHGQVTFEWLEGGFFLVQHVDLNHSGHTIKAIEIIGYGRDWTGTPSQDCTSHLFDNAGNAFTYTWDVDDATLTIWGGERGSPAHFKGTFSDDRNTVTGAWEWPGGGYESTMTRVA